MTPDALLAADLSRLLAEFPLLRTFGYAVALMGALFLIILCVEAFSGGDIRRYRSRPFVTDITYALIYQGGIYATLLQAPVFAVVALVVPSWNLDLLSNLPGPIGFLVYFVAADAIGYWIHRWQHRSPILWCFHSVHHSQTCLTFATSWRNHLAEQLFVNLLMHVPLMVLGMPKWYWAPVMLVQYVLEGLQHSDLNWRYGRLYPVLVSPVFHAIHHSPERARHDANYGKILSVWDRLFGTLTTGERPARYGVAGMPTPVSFWATFMAPFGQLKGRMLRQPPISGVIRTTDPMSRALEIDLTKD
jgi:sterol desaturase/sphingolipid hydroxylase (fatty acid hydroxylase superfamily)